jgi:hypothetical protein
VVLAVVVAAAAVLALVQLLALELLVKEMLEPLASHLGKDTPAVAAAAQEPLVGQEHQASAALAALV